MIIIHCDICGKKHQAGLCSGPVREQLKPVVAKPSPEANLPFASPKDAFNAYMRDYMRKRRAKEKK